MKTPSMLTLGLITAAAFLLPVQGVEAKHDKRDRCDNHPRWHHRHRHHDRHHSGLVFSFNFSPAPVVHTPVRRSVVVNHSLVADVQLALLRRGYDLGPVDGILGPRTRGALGHFQSRQGIHATGQINEPTLRALRLL